MESNIHTVEVVQSCMSTFLDKKKHESVVLCARFLKIRRIESWSSKTWLSDDFSTTINKYLLIHHGTPAIQNGGRRRGGVGIFLSPQARKAWEKAGCPNPITSGVICKAARFIGLRLTLTDHLGKEIKAAICSVYHPTKVADWEYAEFLTKLSHFYDKLNDNNTIIISGNDTNSSIGTRINDYCELDGVADEQSDRHILGPHGIQYGNDRGNDVR
eukprot:scaffold91366_cov50-Attheya_sp.AAC.1